MARSISWSPSVEDRLGDGLKEPGPDFRRGLPVGVEGGPCQGARLVDFGLRCHRRRRLQGFSGRRIGGAEFGLAAVYGSRADKHVAGDVHRNLP